MSRGISDQIGEMDSLGGVIGGEMYEWDDLDMYYDPRARIYRWYSSSGCSCNSIEEDYDNMSSLDEMEFGRKDEAIRAVKRFVEGERQHVRDQGDELIQDL
jgi:hypothetical protein